MGRGSAALGLLAAASFALGCSSIPPGRAAVDAVRFEGVRSVSRKDLGDKIATAPSPKLLGLFQGVVYDYELFDPYVLQRDLERIERYYHARGFYEAHARAARVIYLDDHVRVQIQVEEGPPVVLGEVRVEGIETLPPKVRAAVWDAVRLGGLLQGKRFDEDDFAATEWHIRNALQDESYAYVKVERSARIDLPAHSAIATFVVAPDEPSTIGKITLTGLGPVPPDPIWRALDLHAGERFSASALQSAQEALLNLGVFTSAVVKPVLSDPPPPDHAVPVEVQVTPTRLHAVRLGGGIELDVIKTAVHATAGWTDQNFLGGLRRFDVDFKPGAVLFPTRIPDFHAPTNLLPEERFRAQIRQPGFLESRTTGFVRGQFNVYPLLLTPNIDPAAPVVGYREARGTVGVDRQFWKLYSSLTYNVQLNDPFTYLGELDPDLQSAFIAYADLLTNFDFRDNSARPHEGFFVGNDLQFAGGPLGGDPQDVRIQPQARAYLPIGHATLALRATTGLLFPTNYGSSLALAPPGEAPQGVSRQGWIRDLQLVYFRGFFSGGSNSNRGYPVYGVGPHGPVPFLTPGIAVQQIESECVPGQPGYDASRCALPLGGMTLWEASAELRLPVSSQLEEDTFCDSSDVEVGKAVYSFADPHLSCGVGFGYETPVGVIRLDVAYRIPGLNPRPGDPDYPGDVLGLPIGVAFGIGEAY